MSARNLKVLYGVDVEPGKVKLPHGAGSWNLSTLNSMRKSVMRHLYVFFKPVADTTRVPALDVCICKLVAYLWSLANILMSAALLL